MTRSIPQATTCRILPTVILDEILESVTEIEQKEVQLSNLPCAAQPAAAGEHTEARDHLDDPGGPPGARGDRPQQTHHFRHRRSHRGRSERPARRHRLRMF